MSVFKQHENVKYTAEEKSEMEARANKKLFPMGDSEVTLLTFQKLENDLEYRLSRFDDSVLEYMPIFKNIEGAQQAHFWKIALNWSKAFKNKDIGGLVTNSFKEIQDIGIDPLILSSALTKTEGKAIASLWGLKAIIRKSWSPNKYHLASFKDKKCYLLVDEANNIFSDKEYHMPDNTTSKEEFRKFHDTIANDVFELTGKKAYQQQPSTKILRLETANNSSINEGLNKIVNKYSNPFEKQKQPNLREEEDDDDTPF